MVIGSPSPLALVALLAAVIPSAGCAEGSLSLLVDLRTDLVPDEEFESVRLEYATRPFREGPSTRELSTPVAANDDFVSGRRVGEFAGLEDGPAHVRVSLLDRSGRVVVTRNVTLSLEETTAITVVVTRDCRGVTCPSAGDDPSHTACLAGACVPERCADGACDTCETNGDCSAAVPCAEAVCANGACLQAGVHERCGANEYCDPDVGCLQRGSLGDGGTGCDPSTCDDDNPCTTDLCTGGSCENVPNDIACDDGFFCNGSDFCQAGSCSGHMNPPCTTSCNESTRSCTECMDDTDCGTPSTGSWGSCGGFSDTCDETGTRSRPVMTPRCRTGACTVDATTEDGPCSRDQTGVDCGGGTTYTAWTCGGFADGCATTGTETRTRTDRTCSGGTCQSADTPESRPCSRTIVDGTGCGASPWQVCCGGGCRDLRTDADNCSACGFSCSAIGLSCAATGNGGYGCRSCTSNAMCQSELNASATCWDVASPPAFCQCQCPVDGVCADGGCGPGMFCHDCSGHNFCAPFGGSC